MPTPPLPEEVFETGPSAGKSVTDGAITGRGWGKRCLDKRGDQTGQDGNLQS
jgi:hypothetical protein